MRKPLLLLLLLAGCKGGLPLDEGNAYFCDPTVTRDRNEPDSQCPPDWVCGINGRCIPDERDVLPLDLSPVVFANEAAQRVYPHPALADRYYDVAAISIDAPEVLVLPIGLDAGFRVTPKEVTGEKFPVNAELLDIAYSPQFAAFIVASEGTSPPFLGELTRQVKLRRRSDDQTVTVQASAASANPPLADAWALRGLIDRDGGTHLYVQRQELRPVGGANAGEVEQVSANAFAFRPFVVSRADGGSAGVAVDARPTPRATFERLDLGNEPITPLVLTRTGFFYRRFKLATPSQDVWVELTAPDEEVVPFSNQQDVDPPRLRTDATQTVFAASFSLVGKINSEKDRRHTALSVWRFQRTPTGGTAARAFGDCTPCGATGFIGFTAPTLQNGAVAVDVVCDIDQPNGEFISSVVRVTGSAGNDVRDACATTPFTPTVDPREVTPASVQISRRNDAGTTERTPVRAYALADYLGNGIVVGGAHGQIWRGQDFDDLKPMFLDRVPDDVSTLLGHPFAITERYSARHASAGLATISPSLYQSTSNEPVIPRSAPSDPATQAAGWVVLSGGELARLSSDGGVITVKYGSAMLTAAGAPAPEPYFVEKVDYNGGTHFIVGAGDSLYSSSNEVTDQRGDLPALTPAVTPIPGAALRSFVMDRSTKRTDPVSGEFAPMALGYAVAGNSLFQLTMRMPGGVAERWVAEVKDVGGGEPISVFMRADPDPQALGRVGMRDGRIFSLPSLVQLTGELSAALDKQMIEEGASARALSYASLAELPVMLSEDGLWSPVYRRNNATYGWTLHRFPAELTTGAARERRQRLQTAKLHVSSDGNQQVLYLFTDYGFVYKLASAPLQ